MFKLKQKTNILSNKNNKTKKRHTLIRYVSIPYKMHICIGRN